MLIDSILSPWTWIVAAINIAGASAATVHAVLRKRDTPSAIGWVGLVWLAPLAGTLAYFCLGVNRIERKAVSLRLREAWRHEHETWPGAEDVERGLGLASRYPGLTGLVELVSRTTGADLLPGNRIELLVSGDAAYPSMLGAIDDARISVTLLSFIFDNDRAGERFLEALVKARTRGVAVRVLIDHVGARYSRPSMLERLRRMNVPVAAFLPTRIPRLLKYANLRNHRKILVVDGRVGFTGGTNIREGHWLSLAPRSPVQCAHFRLEGPVVAHLQEAFAIDWAFSSDETLQGETWFPALERTGAVWARGISEGPDEDFEKLSDVLAGALAAASDSVRIVTPYFLPDVSLIRALNVAALRGVAVDIVLPSRSNIPIVQWAATAEYWRVLEKGCRIHLTPPPFDHSKLMVVDGAWSLIGSTNWDPRSLRLNFEYNVECYDADLGLCLIRLLDAKIAGAHRVTLEEVNGRSFPVKVRDGLSRLLKPYM